MLSGAIAQILTSPFSKTPKYEVRAVWLTTIGGLDWPHNYANNQMAIERQQKELCEILDKYQRAGINTILIQTRIRGTMLYPSQYEPWDGCLSGVPGKSPGYDPLEFAINESHKRGMELHAWVVTIPVGKWDGRGCANLRKRFPKLIKKIGPDGYMDPENIQTANYLAGICEEITKNYDIDGIHLDYIRYPETWKLKVGREQGRRHITNIVKEIHLRVKSLKPWVKMSCSPIGKYDDLSRYGSHGWNAYTKGCQDAQGWLRAGLMDELFPMMYFKGDQFYPFAIDWSEQSSGKIIVPGLGIYFMSPNESNWPLSTITQEMQVLRQCGMGHAFFRGKFLTDNLKGIYSFTSEQFNQHPALIPPMTWVCATPPTPPTSLQLSADGCQLQWDGACDKSNGPYLLYNVYCSRGVPVDISDSRNLIATRISANGLSMMKKAENCYFAVTAVDRYGNESQPTFYPEIIKSTNPTKTNYTWLKCNGELVELPSKGSVLDADMVAIESLQGELIATRRFQGTHADVRQLPEGTYIMKSLNRKGVTHRLGFFMIKRKNANVSAS